MPLQMFDPFFDRFDMTEHHGGLDFKPSLCATCITSSHWSLLIFKGEIFCAPGRPEFASSSGDRSQPGFLNPPITSRSGIGMFRDNETPVGLIRGNDMRYFFRMSK